MGAGSAAMGSGLDDIDDAISAALNWQAVQNQMRNIGRLGIPATVNVEFWFGGAPNRNLFMIKDSFIEQVDVNYTPSGGWNAYKDGAPIETQLSISLKETGILSQKDIHVLGGY